MSFGDPVSEAEEAFNFNPDSDEDVQQKSKYDFDGTYNCEVTGVKRGTAASGNPKLTITLVGQEGPAAGLMFTNHAPMFLAKRLAAAVLPRDADGKIKGQWEDLLGRTAAVTFKKDTYNGKTSAKVDAYGPAKATANVALPI